MLTPKIIYEDTDILCIDKPSGLAVHEDGRTKEYVLTDWVRDTYPEIVGVGEEMRLQSGAVIDRPGVVHRLDRATSGILLLAKNQATFLYLKEQFKSRKVQKTYHAFVWAELKESCGTIDKPIGRSKKDFRQWTCGPTAKGTLREAVTRWTRLGYANGFSYLSLEPKTGRTHQIRVHLKAIGHPVVGDTRYAPKKKNALGFERLALHAQAIVFTHPNGTKMSLEAELPPDFLHAQEELEKEY
jgi:23S rRNA pseudouridine1911/1915/1917 synthase